MSNNVLINMRYGPSVRPNDRISAELSFFFFFMDLNFVSVHENAKKKKLTLYPAILTEQAWSIKDVFFGTKRFRLL